MRCDSCDLVAINGVRCHETGCPKAHVGTVRKCDWCGRPFSPDNARQRFCEVSCYASFHNQPTEEGDQLEWDVVGRL